MENTYSFTDILLGIDAANARDKLSMIEAGFAVRKLLLFNKVVDVVYISDNELLLVKCDFPSIPDKEKAWLADEESPLGEIPWYFSENSHRDSPVYTLQRAKMFFSRFFPKPHYHISLLLMCNYEIINYKDMEPQWGDSEITVVHKMSDEPALFPEKANAGETPADNDTSTFSEDDFDKLLDNFIENMESEKEEKGPQSLPCPISQYLTIYEIKMYRMPSGGKASGEPEKLGDTLKVFNIRGLNVVLVHINAFYVFSRKPEGRFKFSLYNETGQLLAHEGLNVQFIPDDYGMDVCIRFSLGEDGSISWKKGKYLLEVKYEEETFTSVVFDVGIKNVKGTFLEKEKTDAEPVRPFETLERLIGLSQVKEQMARYCDLARLAQNRKKSGLHTPIPSLHAVFLGSPGTGKTTVARLYGAMLKELGLLSSGHVVREERSTLMGQNYASEQEKTLEALDKAKGGILFIDEAYSLYKPDDAKDPGRNVLETLLTAMEDDKKGDWALLLAGYTDEMAGLMSFNSGFSSRIPLQNRYHFEDYTVDELMAIADSYCAINNYILTEEARKALRNKVMHDYERRDRTFGNGRYIASMLSNEILQSMSLRLGKIQHPTLLQLMTIEKEDIPALHLKNYKKPLKKLQEMVGLSQLKQNIESHLNMVKLCMLRNGQGIHTELPPLHMVFTGNPGTGKTTVADLIGEIYASLGLLSVGNVIRVERKDLVGACIGETEKKMSEVLMRAQGNVLFIDEAYTLYDSSPNGNDFGRRALETLLTALGREHIDMLVILAGYPEEMEEMFRSNIGLKSRIPYTFYFEDYTVDELMEIAKGVAAKMNYSFTPAALKALRILVDEKMTHRDASWGNARFITRLIGTRIIPAMSDRLMKLPPHRLTDKKTLLTICRSDIPLSDDGVVKVIGESFDEASIRRALRKLDSMIGLVQVKQNIHNFVEVARYLHKTGRSYSDCNSLRWNFTGNTGTGKSTVAGIMGELLKAMNVLEKGHLVEVKAEELYNVSEYKADEILKSAMIRSRQGLLFIDGDAPLFCRPDSCFNSDSLRFKLSSMMIELPGAYALVIGEHESRNNLLAQSLRLTGLPEFDHTFYFEDYTERELCQILDQCLRKKKLWLSVEASSHIAVYIQGLCSRRELRYANARTMKLIADAIAEACWLRVSAAKGNIECEVLLEDVKGFVWKDMRERNRIGYK